MKCKAKKMSEFDKANIEKAADFMRSRHKPSYSQAYEFMLLRYYCKEFKEMDGVRIPVLLPPEERPTFNQALYRIRSG